MTPKQRELLEWIAELWRGDYSASRFDGRDGRRWIYTVIENDGVGRGTNGI